MKGKTHLGLLLGLMGMAATEPVRSGFIVNDFGPPRPPPRPSREPEQKRTALQKDKAKRRKQKKRSRGW